MNEFTPTAYSVESSAGCNEYNHLEDEELKKKLIKAVARLPIKPTNLQFVPFLTQCSSVNSLRVLQHNNQQQLYCTGLL